MFIDASALTAMMAAESEAGALMARMHRSGQRVTSPIARWETTVALARLTGKTVTRVRENLEEFLNIARIRTVPIPPEATAIALDAFERFGKGRHPARLNMGDCFAYACARHFDLPLMYKGNDFALTDIEAA